MNERGLIMRRKSILFIIIAALLMTIASLSVAFADTAAPGQVVVRSVKAKTASSDSGKASVTVKWKKQTSQTTGYEIQYCLKKNFKGAKIVRVTNNTTTKKKIKKLKSKKQYYVRVRTYKTVNGTDFASYWSTSKKVKTK